MPTKDETDETDDTEISDQLSEGAQAAIEHIDEAITKLDDIDRSDLRNRHLKRLDKAKEKLEVAKKSLECLTET